MSKYPWISQAWLNILYYLYNQTTVCVRDVKIMTFYLYTH